MPVDVSMYNRLNPDPMTGLSSTVDLANALTTPER
jgi:hypothetical protein